MNNVVVNYFVKIPNHFIRDYITFVFNHIIIHFIMGNEILKMR